jgi:hypothetical protein
VLKSTYSLETKSLKQGKRYVQKKVPWYSTQDKAAAAAVALVGLGDPEGMKAIKHWLTINVGSKEFLNQTGFDEVVAEVAFAAPKAQAAIKAPLKAAFADLLKLDQTDIGVKNLTRRTAVALLAMGEKTGLPFVLGVLNGSDGNEIKELLLALGGNTNFEGDFRNQFYGVTVGPGFLAAADVQKLIDAIKARMKFWTNESQKTAAVDALLDLQAKLKL